MKRLFTCGRWRKDQTSKQIDTVCEEPTHHSPRRDSFFSIVSEEEPIRRRTFYGRRIRIPTKIDLLRHPSDEWWSDARVDAPHVARDLGAEPRVLGHTVKVRVLDRSEKSANELSAYFPSFVPRPNRRYIIVQLLLGKKIIVSLHQVLDNEGFDSLFEQPPDRLSSLLGRVKLIVNPANVTIPWSITGPKDASSVSDFFGPDNCSIKTKQDSREITYTVITVDVFSKFMIRSFLPKLAFQPGRISDYMLIDYEARTVLAGYRLVCTKTLSELIHL